MSVPASGSTSLIICYWMKDGQRQLSFATLLIFRIAGQARSLKSCPIRFRQKKIHDFSLHQFPTVNLLQELALHTGIKVLILAAQIKHIPDEIAPGLSSAMLDAVTEACEKISQILSIKVNKVTSYDV